MSEQDTQKPCRSVSPDGDPCTKPRAHRKRGHGHHGGRTWEGGINTPAVWVRADNDHMSEADHQTWGRL